MEQNWAVEGWKFLDELFNRKADKMEKEGKEFAYVVHCETCGALRRVDSDQNREIGGRLSYDVYCFKCKENRDSTIIDKRNAKELLLENTACKICGGNINRWGICENLYKDAMRHHPAARHGVFGELEKFQQKENPRVEYTEEPGGVKVTITVDVNLEKIMREHYGIDVRKIMQERG